MYASIAGASPLDFFGSSLVLRVGRLVLTPFDICLVIVALAVALFSSVGLWRIAGREDRQKKLFQALRRNLSPHRSFHVLKGRPPWHQRLGTQIASMKIIGTAKQQSLLACLDAAGFKGHGHLPALIAGKLCGAMAFPPLGWLFLEWRRILLGWPTLRLAALAIAIVLGWRFPEVVLSRLAVRRRLRFENAIPDALDLLVICAEAGLRTLAEITCTLYVVVGSSRGRKR